MALEAAPQKVAYRLGYRMLVLMIKISRSWIFYGELSVFRPVSNPRHGDPPNAFQPQQGYLPAYFLCSINYLRLPFYNNILISLCNYLSDIVFYYD